MCSVLFVFSTFWHDLLPHGVRVQQQNQICVVRSSVFSNCPGFNLYLLPCPTQNQVCVVRSLDFPIFPISIRFPRSTVHRDFVPLVQAFVLSEGNEVALVFAKNRLAKFYNPKLRSCGDDSCIEATCGKKANFDKVSKMMIDDMVALLKEEHLNDDQKFVARAALMRSSLS